VLTCPDCGEVLEIFPLATSGIQRCWCDACQVLFDGGDAAGLRRSISVNTSSRHNTAWTSAACLARTTALALTRASSSEGDDTAASGASAS
jgi:hypothetical protein